MSKKNKAEIDRLNKELALIQTMYMLGEIEYEEFTEKKEKILRELRK